MARARSAKDSKDARKESGPRGTKAPANTAGDTPHSPDSPFPAWTDQLLALRDRVDALEARVNTLADPALASDLAVHDATTPHVLDDTTPVAALDDPALADPALAPQPDAVPALDVSIDGSVDGSVDGDEAGDHDPIDGDVPVGPTPAQLRARHGKPGGLWIVGAARLPRGVRATWSRDVATADILDRDWAAQADVLGALAHPVRLAVVREVLRGSRSVSSLAALPGVGTSGQLYHHIKPLLAAGWLRQDGRGRYEVPESRVLRLLTLIAALEA